MNISGITNNGVITYDNVLNGGSVESNLIFDGTDLTLTGNLGASGYISATSYVTSTVFRETFSDLGTGGSVTINLSTANNFRRQFNATSTH
jgi:hypothetical protein